MAKIRNEELEQLAGEVLPERTVLSAVPMDASSGGTSICSPNGQSNSVAGNLFALGIAGLNQCGLSNQGQATGFDLQI